MKTEEKLAKSAKLIKEAALQFEKAGLELDFQITIKALPPTVSLNCIIEPEKNIPPSK